jgi:hypothetical protein
MAEEKKSSTAQTVRLDPETVPDPPVESKRKPAARVSGTSEVSSPDLDGPVEVATVEVTGFEHEGKAVTLRFEGVPAADGKVTQETLDSLLTNTAVAWQRIEDRRDWVRDYGSRS